MSELLGPELMYLLNMQDYDLNNPRLFAKFNEVVKYFQHDEHFRPQVLKVIAAKDKKLEAIWEYVSLQNSKAQVISQLNPDNFGKDIADELRSGYLTLDSIKAIEKDIQSYKKKSLPETDSFLPNIQKTESAIQELASINEAIERY